MGLALVAVACTDGDDGPTPGEADAQASDDRPGVDVTIDADGLELQGTLRLPDGAGPHPGVVIAHGSGPSSRRGVFPGQLGMTFPAPVAVYEQLAEGLQAEGFAVLTFDKRTCGPFNGCADNDYPLPSDDLRFETFVDDLDAVVDHLAAREDIDRLAVAGHSKGGTVAAQLATRRGDLDALVLVATPAVGVPELLAGQAETMEDLTIAVGQQGPRVQRELDGLRSLADAVAAVADGEVEGDPIGGRPGRSGRRGSTRRSPPRRRSRPPRSPCSWSVGPTTRTSRPSSSSRGRRCSRSPTMPW
ncbi:MAG: alpha/beta fold hydrolase [Nitriliruptoraceae bacterium]|nr:alpha/beta fold hydrolase [Nitriliruptoraceae bacterium]